MTAPYMDLAVLKDVLGITDTAMEAHLERALEAASEVIDAKCGRTFRLSAADETLYYYPNCDGVVEVVDLVSVTSIAIDTNRNETYTTTLATTDYELLPLNLGRYDRIRSRPTSSRQFSPDRKVKIVGKRGYVIGGQPPTAVVQACQLLCTRLHSRKDAPFGVLQTAEMGQYLRLSAEDPDVVALLKPYARTNQWCMV